MIMSTCGLQPTLLVSTQNVAIEMIIRKLKYGTATTTKTATVITINFTNINTNKNSNNNCNDNVGLKNFNINIAFSFPSKPVVSFRLIQLYLRTFWNKSQRCHSSCLSVCLLYSYAYRETSRDISCLPYGNTASDWKQAIIYDLDGALRNFKIYDSISILNETDFVFPKV